MSSGSAAAYNSCYARSSAASAALLRTTSCCAVLLPGSSYTFFADGPAWLSRVRQGGDGTRRSLMTSTLEDDARQHGGGDVASFYTARRGASVLRWMRRSFTTRPSMRGSHLPWLPPRLRRATLREVERLAAPREVIHHVGQSWLGLEFHFYMAGLLNSDVISFVALLNLLIRGRVRFCVWCEHVCGLFD